MPKSAKRRMQLASQKFYRNNRGLALYYGAQCKIISSLINKYGADYSENQKALDEKEIAMQQLKRYKA